ncbi:MAG: hypothetical protein HYV28_11430 [Ignavibacteriales bacterium]|nr:hypothetical protein [Ignavibacteriales bacterium]
MDFSNIFLFSFYALLVVLFVVIVIPALYSMFGKKRTVSTPVHSENKVSPSRLTVVNSDSVNVANLSALTSSGALEQSRRTTDFTSKVKIQESKVTPRQPKFEVFNQAQVPANNAPQPVKNWSSHWN